MSARISWEELREKFPEIYAREMERRRVAGNAVERGSSVIPLRETRPGETGPWIVEIPGWCPPSINRYYHGHWAERARTKKRAIETVALACRLADLPLAATRRRLSIRLTLPKGRRAPDEDNIGKGLRDGLTAYGAIVDDAPEWCETGAYEIDRGPLKTTMTLEDV